MLVRGNPKRVFMTVEAVLAINPEWRCRTGYCEMTWQSAFPRDQHSRCIVVLRV